MAQDSQQPDCIFCGIVAGSIPSTTVHEDDRVLAFMDINPSTKGHLLVTPKQHHRDLLDLPPDLLGEISVVAQTLARAAVDGLGAAGVNLVNSCGKAAWQDVFHFHLHVVPRYEDAADDHLNLLWNPQPGDLDQIAATAAVLRGEQA